jgi:hypothetical protein
MNKYLNKASSSLARTINISLIAIAFVAAIPNSVRGQQIPPDVVNYR